MITRVVPLPEEDDWAEVLIAEANRQKAARRRKRRQGALAGLGVYLAFFAVYMIATQVLPDGTSAASLVMFLIGGTAWLVLGGATASLVRDKLANR